LAFEKNFKAFEKLGCTVQEGFVVGKFTKTCEERSNREEG